MTGGARDILRPFERYVKAANRKIATGEARELSFRSGLENLLSDLEFPMVLNEPKRIECGAPDLAVMRGGLPVGHIETKTVNAPLDQIERTGQLQRYFEGLNNLILTDYIEFRHYIAGERQTTARLADWNGKKQRFELNGQGAENVRFLLDRFLDADCEAPAITTTKNLAARMAGCARQMRFAITQALELEKQEAGDAGKPLRDMPIHGQLDGMRQILIHDMTADDYADMEAQTICYGMFSARFHTPDKDTFTRETAQFRLPSTNPFLAKAFVRIGGVELDERVAWAADELAAVLNRTDMRAIESEFKGKTRRGDPVVYFYEHFLDQYDPRRREERGVYYTPGPVVSYIVRSVDEILKRDFGLDRGLADERTVPSAAEDGVTSHKVHILDPAAGTGTFLDGVIDFIRDTYFNGLQGLWRSYVREHLLPRLHGFEFLMAPYAIAHLKLDRELAETGAELYSSERVNVFLTNTLEEPHGPEHTLPFTQWLADEAGAASDVKRDKPVMVVLGNPPYSGHSANPSERTEAKQKGATYERYHRGKKRPELATATRDLKAVKQRTFIGHLLRGWDSIAEQETGSYFHVDGAPLDEKNPKYIHDDYVKFIRFAQWRIERTGHGIIGFITNNSYLDSPTLRGMRQCLIDTFDEIYIIDLHGNEKRKEVAPDGSKDENVFGITLGVSICLLIKRKEGGGERAKVFHAEIWGPNEQKGEYPDAVGKYAWLSVHHVGATRWAELSPASPDYVFVPRDETLGAEYKDGWPLPEILPLNVHGFKSHRDHFAVAFSENEMHQRIADMRRLTISDDEIRAKYNLRDNRDWQLDKGREKLRAMGDDWLNPHIRCSYRPFDSRYCYLDYAIMDRPGREILDHVFQKNNLCLGAGRQGQAVNDHEWNLVTASAYPLDTNGFRRGGVTVFPLFVFADKTTSQLQVDGQYVAQFEDNSLASNGKQPNLAPGFTKALGERTGLDFITDATGDLATDFGPEDVFHYIYAILHAPSYRERYRDFLKTDFPRIPLPGGADSFRSLCGLGRRLVDLHLMRANGPAKPNFDAGGSDEVEKPRYERELERVWINQAQYFEPVPQAVWEFRVGGYQPAEKWLKDRKGRALKHDDIQHYRSIIAAMGETIQLMTEIDAVIEKAGGWPL
ncbi:MAG: type ISP restriction/modification enzyme [Sphingomonadales bacterium]